MAGELIPMGPMLFTAGGLIDSSKATLAIYGDDLDPEQVTAKLGVAPTRSQRRGVLAKDRTVAARVGAWFLSEQGAAPEGPNELAHRLKKRLPEDPVLWASLGEEVSIQMRFGLFQEAWNRGFDLDPEVVAWLGRIGATLVFDIYANGEE